jgi:hypothetical protein
MAELPRVVGWKAPGEGSRAKALPLVQADALPLVVRFADLVAMARVVESSPVHEVMRPDLRV